MTTSLDSEIAKHYFEFGLESESAQELGKAIETLHAKYDPRPLNWQTIKSISAEASPDFGALYFARRLRLDVHNERFQQEFQKEYECLKSNCPNGQFLKPLYPEFKFLVVGGLHYKSEKSTGADLAGPRKYLALNGIDIELLDLDEDGIVEENAALIAQRIRSERDGRKIVIVSASKGGLDVAYALGKILTHRESEKVKGWVSIGGILHGTFLADEALKFPQRWLAKLVLWWVGMDSKCLPGMTTEVSRKRMESLVFPKHLLMISYVGVLLSGQLSKEVRGRYKALRKHGPSDGLTLLPDAVIPGSRVVLEWGLDHYFRDPEIEMKALALANLVVKKTTSR